MDASDDQKPLKRSSSYGQLPPYMSDQMRIVMLGKTGSGKSSLANTIFGEEQFKISRTAKSETKNCKAETKTVNGRNITLIDTPGLFNTDRSEEEMKPEIVRCITECAPGPHAFLIVLKVEKFTEHEEAVINKVKEYFSEEAFKYATLIFTYGDELDEDQTIDDFVSNHKLVDDLVKKCGGRCHVIDNRRWNKNSEDKYRSNQFQVEELLKSIDKMVEKNEGRCYTNEMLQAVEKQIQKERECSGLSSANMSEKETSEQDKYNICAKLLTKSHDEPTVSDRRIVILGRIGSGKSSLANTIFGEELFKIGHTLNSETTECKAKTRSVNGRNITLIDTRGFFDTDTSEDVLKGEIVRCITECTPGPHAFLIVLKVERFTEQEQAVINKIGEYFSEEAFKYATVIFTHGDQLSEGRTVEDFVCKSKPLTDLVKKCGGRCHIFDNKYWNINAESEYRSNQFQVKELLKSIDRMMEINNGSCYTNDMLQEVEREIQKEMELIRQSSPDMLKEEIRQLAKDRIFMGLYKKWAVSSGPIAAVEAVISGFVRFFTRK